MNFNIDLTNTPICHVHNFIQDECVEIMSAIQESPLKDTIKEEIIEQRIAKILYMSKLAEEQGQKMEDRLKEYRSGIEAMGFIRAKKMKDTYSDIKDNDKICPICGSKLIPVPYYDNVEIDGVTEKLEFIDYFCDVHGTLGRDF